MKKSLFIWIAPFIILLDQLTKILVRRNIELYDVIKVTPKFFWLTNVRNTGAAFSFSFGSDRLNQVLFMIITLIAIALIIYLKLHSDRKIEHLIFSIILGGAIGNFIDRIFFGSVTDFLWCDFPDIIMNRWPVFNIADSSIVVAIILLIISTLFQKKPLEVK